MPASPSMLLSFPARFRVPPHGGLSRCRGPLRRALGVACGILLPLLSLVPSPLPGQTGQLRVSVPSPTSASLGKFGDVPVGLFAGTPSLSIPLFTAKGRTLDLPITLRYSAGGIRVQEIGSWVGIGWALDAGGVITRTVRGKVDEFAGGYASEGWQWYQSANWPVPSQTAIDDVAAGILDGEPDLFFFSFAGRSGQFVMGATATPSVLEYRPIPYQALRIVPVFGAPGVPDQWIVTTEDGTRYTFAATETTHDLAQNSSLQINPNPVSYTSSWYLTRIETVGGDSITLAYTPNPVQTRHKTATYQEKFSVVSGQSSCVEDFDVFNEDGIDGVHLASITTAQHTVTFSTGTALRSDALSPTGQPQEVRLDRITVSTPGGVVLREFQLSQDYSTGRLTLLGVTERNAAGIALPPYTFTYSGPTLPGTTSFAQDHWGYSNGKTANSTMVPSVAMRVPGATGVEFTLALPGADRTPDSATMRAGILTRVTYPTGGSTEFLYEPHDYGMVGSNPALPVMEGPLQTASAAAGSGGIGTTPFVVGGTQDVFATVLVQQSPGDCGTILDPPCPTTTVVGPGGAQWQWTDGDATHYLLLAPGGYTLIADGKGNPAGSAQIIVTWREILPTPKAIGGGVRLMEQRDDDGMGHITTTQFRYTLSSDPTRSSGRVFRTPVYTYQKTTPVCSYLSRSSTTKVPLGSGSFVGYTEVTVLHGAGGVGGRSVHHFTYEPDQQDGEWPGATPTSLEWQRGLEVAVEEYNAAGRLQQRTVNSYAVSQDTLSLRIWPGMSMNVSTTGGGLGQASIAVSGAYQVFSPWTTLVADTTIQYAETGTDSLVTARRFTYGNPVHAQLTEQVEAQSDGSERVTRFTYAADYPPGSGSPEADALREMAVSAHMLSQVIEKVILARVQTTETVVRAELTTYKAYQPGQYLPFKRYLFDSATPVVVP